jgi:hypothetical protein
MLLSALLIAQLGDAATFMVGVSIHGIHLESNIVAVMAHEATGTEGVLIMKGAGILSVLAILVMAAERFPRVVFWGAATATGVGMLGVATNLTSLLIIAG